MPTLWLRALRLAFVFTFLLGCAGGARHAAAPPPPRPSCSPAPSPGVPYFCAPSGQPDAFVAGLRTEDGWDRGDWVMLDITIPGIDQPVPAAMVEVTERYPDLAKVHLLYQSEARSLVGARARRIRKDDRARLGKFVARITQLDLVRVRIDVGALDKVVVGDVYAILSPRDHTPIGRVEITEVGDLYAWGKRLDQREELRSQLDAVWLRDATAGALQPLLIVVVNFDPHDPKDTEESKAGRGFAKDLADALATSAKGSKGLTVRYAGEEQVRLGAGDEEGHKEARYIGKRYQADIVVWGSMRCDKQACAQPRFTVVEPERLKTRESKGEEIFIERDRAGFAFKGTPPEDPLALGAAILGSVYYAAERYADVRYYLELAVSKNVLRGEDEFVARQRLAYAMCTGGQILAARQQAEVLVQHARAAHDERWEQVGRREIARLDVREGNTDAAQVALRAIRDWSTAHGDSVDLSYALYRLALLEAEQGRVDAARTLYQQALYLQRRLGDVKGSANTLHGLGILEAGQGRVDAARALYQQALDLDKRIGDVQNEARALNQIAGLEMQQGRVDAARALHQQSLDLLKRIGDVQGEAQTLHEMAFLEVQQGRVDAARALYQQSLDLDKRIRDVRGEAATLHGLAGLEMQQGRVDAARALFQQSLDLQKRIGDVRLESATLHNLAALEARQGRVDAARALYQQSLDLDKRIGDVQGELTTLVNMAYLDYKQGKADIARRTMEGALEKARTVGLVEVQASILNVLAQIDVDQGNLARARERWVEAKRLFEQLKMASDVAEVTEYLATLVLFEKAAEAWKAQTTTLAGGGVFLTAVQPDGQAAKAALEPGDILLRYGATRLDKPATLQQIAQATDPSKTAPLEILRGAQKLTVQVHGGPLGIDSADLPPNPAAPKASP